MQTSLEIHFDKTEVGRLPVLLDDVPYKVRAAIHESHSEGERADMLFLELFSLERESSDPKSVGSGSPLSIVHARIPMRLVSVLSRKVDQAGTVNASGLEPATIDRREYEPSGIEVRQSREGTRADELAITLRHLGLVEHERTIVFPRALLRILLAEGEKVA